MKKLAIYIACLAMSLPLAARNYYVKPDGSPTLSGTSWGWASNNLQAMVDKAVVGDVVYVAVGTYSGGFLMKDGVNVKGGYTANSDKPEERYNLLETTDPAKQSILDGGNMQRVLTQNAPFSTPTTWEGFVIQNGRPSVEFKVGSLIYSQDASSDIVGVLYQYDVASGQGKIFSKEEIRKQWGGYNDNFKSPLALYYPIQITPEEAKADLKGENHTSNMLTLFYNRSIDFMDTENGVGNNYAAYWCDTLSIGGYSDWYLPAAGELQQVQEAGILPILKSIGKDVLRGYWSSSHVGKLLGWAYYFGNGYVHPALKYIQYNVSAVCDFIKPSEAGGMYTAGGGVLLAGNGILSNCIVKNNTSNSRGGGVYVGAGGQLINCTVEGNSAPEGKEVYYEIATGIVPVAGTQIKAYPNPLRAGEYLTVERNTTAPAGYQWLNAAGLTVKTGKLQAGENRVASPSEKGIYLLLIQSENTNYHTKIIIQ